MSIFRDFFVKEKPVFTGITRGIGGFSFGASAGGGGGAPGVGELASGGARFTVPDAPGYTYHVFNDIHSSANFVNTIDLDCEILLVGGGGGGGSDINAGASAGGGGGAVVYHPSVSLTAGSYAVYVGQGGNANFIANNSTGGLGGNSVFGGPSSGPWPSPFALVALGGGGGGNQNPGGNSDHDGADGGTGGGGAGNDGAGGGTYYSAPNPQSLPAASITYGHGGAGRKSTNSPATQRAGGGGGAGGPSAPVSPHSAQTQGGRSGYEVPATFLPTSCPSDFANLIGGAHPSSLGGAIGTPSNEWRYFGGGGGASDNHSASQGDGGLGGGGNAGFAADTSPWPLMSRTANPFPNSTTWGVDKSMAPGTGGRGGGGSGNGSDNPAPQPRQCWGGSGGSGCVIIKAQYTSPDGTFAATGGTNQPNGISVGSYTYHVFADDGNFVVSSGTKAIDFLIVAGGGGGANGQGGGGGAGGVVYGTSVIVGKGSYPVEVGAGGAGGAAPGYANPGAKGSNSKFGTLIAIGGGGGAQNNWGHPDGAPNQTPGGPYPATSDQSHKVVGGSSGGCGGGTKSGSPGPDMTNAYPYAQNPNMNGVTMYNNITQYGNMGGNQGNQASGSGGGGGGAGGAGGGSTPGPRAGGNGQPFPAFPGPGISPGMPSPQQSAFASAVGPTGLFSGGGGGGNGGSNSGGSAGPGGGGAGGNSNNAGNNGIAGTGGGAGGSGSNSYSGGTGGSGIVVIRYLT